MKFKYNPKLIGSGIIECIPQAGECPNHCNDCFFQSGRSYLEPLAENLPHIPTSDMAEGRVVRMNDGNDSNIQRELVEKTAKQYKDYFFNTSIPKDLESFSGPVVLTINPGKMTDEDFYKLDSIPENLMFVRVRVNCWNVETVLLPAIKYYTERGVPVVVTFMAYYTEIIPEDYKESYEWQKRILNSYWVLTKKAKKEIERYIENNQRVHICGYKGTYDCKNCGNCLREYYSTKDRIRWSF